MRTIVSGIKPTGSLNIGTYLGSIRNFVKLQNEYEDHHFFLFIADLHAITIPIDRLYLRKKIKELAALYLACGLQRERLSLFIQSEVPAHSHMGYLLQCFTYMGELERMTQFKEKSRSREEGIPSSLFTYPSLMAGDILLYDAEYVPVGEDQKQHLELTRDLAERVNRRFDGFFTVPEPLIPQVGARIKSLTDPSRKMSKSDDDPKGHIDLLESPDLIRKRIRSAVTDSGSDIRFDPEEKPGIANLLTIFGGFTDTPVHEIARRYQDASYKTFKDDLAEVVVQGLAPIRERYEELIDSDELDRILDEGKESAARLANRKVAKFNHKLGLGRKRK